MKVRVNRRKTFKRSSRHDPVGRCTQDCPKIGKTSNALDWRTEKEGTTINRLESWSKGKKVEKIKDKFLYWWNALNRSTLIMKILLFWVLWFFYLERRFSTHGVFHSLTKTNFPIIPSPATNTHQYQHLLLSSWCDTPWPLRLWLFFSIFPTSESKRCGPCTLSDWDVPVQSIIRQCVCHLSWERPPLKVRFC